MTLPRYIPNNAAIVNSDGTPTTWFQSYINGTFDALRTNATTAQNAQTAADAALAASGDAGTDGILTAHEKFTLVLPSYNFFSSTNSDFVAKATAYGTPVASLLTTYNTAYSAWTTYLATLTSPTMWNDTSGQTNITRSAWDSKWEALTNARDALDNAMTAQAGQQAVWASVTGPNRPADNATQNIIYYSTSAPGSPNNGDIWVDTSVTPNVTRFRLSGAWQVGANLTTNTNQLTDGAGLGSTAIWASVTGPNRPADNATQNIIYYSGSAPTSPNNGDMWVDTSVNPNVTRVRISGAWQVAANLTTNTNQLTDGAGLGTTATWTGVTGTGTPETGADITRWVDGPPQSTVFAYDYTGVAESGEFSRDLTFTLMAPSGQITSGVTWTYTVQTGTVNTFTNASGAQSMSGSGTGTLTVSSLGSNSTILVTAVFSSKTIVRTFDLTQHIAAPPVSGGSGTTTLVTKTSGFSPIGTTTYGDVTGSMTGTMPTGKTTATVAVQLHAMPNSGTTGSWTVDCKVMRDITGTPTQIGSVQTGSSDWNSSDVSGDYAVFNFTVSDTGLTAGTSYTWHVYMNLASGSRTHSITGTVSVTA